SRAQDVANFTVTQLLIRKVKRHRTTVGQPIPVRVTYDDSAHSVSLFLTGRPRFARGGQIVVNDSPPTGLTGVAGDYLDGSGTGVPGSNGTFTILPKGRGLVR